MNYFVIKQPENAMFIIAPNISQKEFWSTTNEIVFCLTENKCDRLMFLPLYTYPAWLLSESAYLIISRYQINQKFKPCILGEKGTHNQDMYYAFQSYELDCLHESSQFFPDKTIKKMILNTTKIGNHKIFQPQGILERYLVVDLEILEKLLCAGIYPIEWEKVDCV